LGLRIECARPRGRDDSACCGRRCQSPAGKVSDFNFDRQLSMQLSAFWQPPPSRAGLIFRKVSRERGSRLMLFRLIEGLNATLGDWTEYRKPFREVLPLDEPASAEGQTDDY
jgi:hypothetical protein